MKSNLMKNPRKCYENQKEKFKILINEQKKIFSKISYIRILVFIGTVSSSIYFFYNNYIYAGYILIIFATMLFLLLIVIHSKIKEKIQLYDQIIKLNDSALARLNDNWIEFTDNGADFIDNQHAFSYDLDLFGKGSLFQYISCCNTFTGREYLKNSFLRADKKIDLVQKFQQAIKELAGELNWRQVFQALGMLNNENINQNPEKLIQWSKDRENIIKNKKIQFCLRILPVITFLFVFLSYYELRFFRIIAFALFIVQLFLTRYKKSEINNILVLAVKYKEQLSVYKRLLLQIEGKSFGSEYLVNIKNNLNCNKIKKPSKLINKLESIVGFINLRKSNIYPLFNILFLYSWQCFFILEKWKRNSEVALDKWLNTIGELESLSSLSILAFDHSQWCFPEFVNKNYFFNAVNIGHPLLPGKVCVRNDFSFSGEGKVVMVTGSNMSGKSTMLRTIGLNLILAYAGAPVCATEMKCSLMDIYTSMRVVDNLKGNISSFYAELLRIKMILDAIKSGKKVFFLLDEIFKGTNSRDRKMGAITVIKNFTTAMSTGIVSTHDLELTDLENDKNYNVQNYFFKETYQNEQIYFDYKIRKGISNTSDVMYLMKIIGLNLEPN